MHSRLFTLLCRLALPVLAGLSACAAGPVPLNTTLDELVLYAGGPQPGLHVQLVGWQDEIALTGASATVPKPANPDNATSHVSAQRSARHTADDALTMRWNEAWFAGLRLVADKPVDLRSYLPDGTLEFDVDAVDMAKSGLNFAMACGADCGRKLKYVLPSRAMQGQGWQHLSFALRCFERDGNDFSAITQPFAVESSGTGEVALANVRIVRHGKPNASCVDYRVESVTPAPLAEVWAIDWWMPRHQQKLQQVRALNAAGRSPQLVFVGDSITHNWETAGATVWAEHYARYNAVDLGFGGDRTENVLWRIEHGELDGLHPKVAVLMIGTNNTGDRQEDPRTTAAGIQRILGEMRQRMPGSKVLLLAVFPRDAQPTSRLRQLNDRLNGLISAYADGQNVFFLNIGDALTEPDGTLSKDLMPDLLHPNEKGYAIWARAMEPTLQKLMASQ